MLTRNILILLALGIFFSSCASNKAPEGWLKEEKQFISESFGAWATVEFKYDSIYYHCRNIDQKVYTNYDILFFGLYDSEDSTIFLGGELIATDSVNLWLLTLEHGIKQIDITKVYEIDIQTTDNKLGSVGTWAFLGTLSTLSHGFFLVGTAPIWLITGIGTASAESRLNRYTMEKDDAWTGIDWNKVNLFCRFPQGISQEMDVSKLKPKIELNREKEYESLMFR